jgi:hypothetical protein
VLRGGPLPPDDAPAGDLLDRAAQLVARLRYGSIQLIQ